MYTSWCGTPLVLTSVPSGSIVFPSRCVQRGSTPLLKASWNGHAEVARFLLESGSSVQEQNNVGWPKGASVKHPEPVMSVTSVQQTCLPYFFLLIYSSKLCNCTQIENCYCKWVSSYHWVWKWVHVCIPWGLPYRHCALLEMAINGNSNSAQL